MRFSWSRLKTFHHCLRKYDIQYNNGISRPPGTESRAMLLGSLVHAGFQAYLVDYYHTEQPDIEEAVTAVNRYIDANIPIGKDTYNWDTGMHEDDEEYRVMVGDIWAEAHRILAYQLPRLGLGDRYEVAGLEHFNLGEGPMVEYEFEFNVKEDVWVKGFIDAVL